MYNSGDLLDKIKSLHEDLYASSRIRTHAQGRVTEILGEAVEILSKDGNSLAELNEAASKIGLARATLNLAHSQSLAGAIFITLWSFGFLAAAGTIIVGWRLFPQLQNDPSEMVLLGSVAWGVGGASIHGLVELHRRFARQEFDIRRSLWYISHPVIGGGLGAIVFLFALGGLLVTGQTDVLPVRDNGSTGAGQPAGFNASSVLVLAAIVGFEQPHVISYISNTVRRVFGVREDTVTESG